MTLDEPLHVVLIEDDPADAKVVERMIRTLPEGSVEMTHYGRLEEGIEAVADLDPDVAIIDLRLPDSDDRRTMATFREHCPDLPTIVYTGVSKPELVFSAQELMIDTYLSKRLNSQEAFIRSLLRAARSSARRSRAKASGRLEEVFNHLNRRDECISRIRDAVHKMRRRDDYACVVEVLAEELTKFDVVWYQVNISIMVEDEGMHHVYRRWSDGRAEHVYKRPSEDLFEAWEKGGVLVRDAQATWGLEGTCIDVPFLQGVISVRGEIENSTLMSVQNILLACTPVIDLGALRSSELKIA